MKSQPWSMARLYESSVCSGRRPEAPRWAMTMGFFRVAAKLVPDGRVPARAAVARAWVVRARRVSKVMAAI